MRVERLPSSHLNREGAQVGVRFSVILDVHANDKMTKMMHVWSSQVITPPPSADPSATSAGAEWYSKDKNSCFCMLYGADKCKKKKQFAPFARQKWEFWAGDFSAGVQALPCFGLLGASQLQRMREMEMQSNFHWWIDNWIWLRGHV